MIRTGEEQREAIDVGKSSCISRTGGHTGDQGTRYMAEEGVSKERRISKGKKLLKRKGEVHDLVEITREH